MTYPRYCTVLAGLALATACGGKDTPTGMSSIDKVPPPPTGAAATAGDGHVTVSWSAVAGATAYNLYWSTTAGVTKATGTQISGLTSTAHVHAGRTNGTTYYYVVTAVNTAGESAASTQVSATPLAPPPAAPTGAAATAGDGHVTVSWSAVAGATAYNLYWSTTAGVTKATGTQISGITSTSHVHAGLINGTTYYYVVAAVNAAGESAASTQVSATPQLGWVVNAG